MGKTGTPLWPACTRLGRCRDPWTGHGVFPDSAVYSAAISVCPARQAVRLFYHLVEHGPAHGVCPELKAYGATLTQCRKSCLHVEALRVFDHLVLHGRVRGLFPDTRAYNDVISACRRNGRVDKVLELFRDLRTKGRVHGALPDSTTYDNVIGACDKGGRIDEIPGLLRLGIEDKVFQRDLGLNEANELNLREHAVLVKPIEPDRLIQSEVARAIFRGLSKPVELYWGEGARGIDHETRFIVGQGQVRAVIAECMRERGWTPAPPSLGNYPTLDQSSDVLVAQPSNISWAAFEARVQSHMRLR